MYAILSVACCLLKPVLNNFTKGFCTYSYNGRGELQGLSSPVIDSTGDATKNTTCSKRVEKEIKSQKESNNHNMSLAESNKKKRILTNFSSDEEETTPNRKLRNSDIKSLR